jgi:hypothetical protein
MVGELTAVATMPDLERRNRARCDQVAAPAPWIEARGGEDLQHFPPESLVRELLQRYWSARRGAAAGHVGGAGSSPDFVTSVNLTLNRARRLLRAWHPDLYAEAKDIEAEGDRAPWCPIEEYFRLDGLARRAVQRAAEYQLHHVRGCWSTRQAPRRDTVRQAEARRLWARADKACSAVERHENSREFGLLVAFVGLVMALWSVHEEPETFYRYVYG